jgi:hypothetical protein
VFIAHGPVDYPGFTASLKHLTLDIAPEVAPELCVLFIFLKIKSYLQLFYSLDRMDPEPREETVMFKKFKMVLDKHKRSDGYRARAKDTEHTAIVAALYRRMTAALRT